MKIAFYPAKVGRERPRGDPCKSHIPADPAAGTSRIPAAVISLISLITGLLTTGSVRSSARNADPTHAKSQLNAAVEAAIATAVVGGLSWIGPWRIRLRFWFPGYPRPAGTGR